MYSGARKSCTKAINEIFSGNMLIIAGNYGQGNIGMAFWVIMRKTGRLAHSWALGSWDTECQDCQRAAGGSTMQLGHCQMTHLYWQTVTDAKLRHSHRANWHQTRRICKCTMFMAQGKIILLFYSWVVYSLFIMRYKWLLFLSVFFSLLEGKTFLCMLRHKYPFN